jgi:pimeloyl-ACP methyl ester carboxylesterase
MRQGSTLFTLEDATHFVHLDRPERGRAQLFRSVFALLASA